MFTPTFPPIRTEGRVTLTPRLVRCSRGFRTETSFPISPPVMFHRKFFTNHQDVNVSTHFRLTPTFTAPSPNKSLPTPAPGTIPPAPSASPSPIKLNPYRPISPILLHCRLKNQKGYCKNSASFLPGRPPTGHYAPERSACGIQIPDIIVGNFINRNQTIYDPK